MLILRQLNYKTFLFLLIPGFVVLLFFAGCSKTENDYRTSWSPPVKIKGFQYRNDVGETMADIGQPDIRLRYPDNYEQWKMALFCYPSPASSEMSVAMAFAGDIQTVRLWIVPATFADVKLYPDICPANAVIDPINRPVMDTVFTPAVGTTHLRIRGLDAGFYRIYMKSEGITLWDNIVFVNSK